MNYILLELFNLSVWLFWMI